MSTQELQQDWTGILARVRGGESVLIEEDGQPVGQLIPAPANSSSPKTGKRTFGSLAGKIKVPDDFNEMMREEIEEMFYGKP